MSHYVFSNDNINNIVKVKVKRFIGQPHEIGLTNFKTKQIIKKDEETEKSTMETYRHLQLEINMMANLQLYL